MGRNSTSESKDGLLSTDSPLSNDCENFSGGSNGGIVLKKGPWTSAEDAILVDYVKKHGEGNWNAVQKNSGLTRCGKSCRLRWANHLRPNLKKGAFTPEEERLIIELHAKMGNKWARMAAHLPGRTDNEIKNYWNTRIKRRQRAGLPLYPPDLNVDAQTENQQRLSSSGIYGDNRCHDIMQSNAYKTPDIMFDSFDIPYAPEFPGITGNVSKGIGFGTQFYSFVSQTIGVAKFAQEPDEIMPDYGRGAAFDRDQTDSCVNKMSQSLGLHFTYGPDHTKKLLPFGVNEDSNHMSNVIFSASKHFAGAQKLELPSLQYQETGLGLWDPSPELLDSIVQSPPLSLSGPFLSSHCPSPGSSGLLEDLLYEAKALGNQSSDWSTSSNFSHGDMSDSSALKSRSTEFKGYLDPSSPSGNSIGSIFNVYVTETISEEHVVISVQQSEASAGDEFSGPPHDRWLPITESRNGTTLKAAFHLLCSGIGVQLLLLPIAFIYLGWYWGIISLSLAFSWQLYTKWLLINLHESSPQPGIRYNRYLHLSIVAFGEKIGKLLGLFPTLYLSTGTCIMFIITGGTVMELLFQVICDLDCKAKTLTGAQWFLLFTCIAVFAAQFFPNLDSLALVSALGSFSAVFYCFLLWVVSVNKGRLTDPVKMDDDGIGFRDALNGFPIIALAFRGHNLVLEIQGTIPTNRKKTSRKSMWRGVIISYLLIAMCMYPIAIVGHWAYENKVYPNLGILTSFVKFHQKSTSKFVTGAICFTAIIHYLCAYQIYAMPALDNFERIYVTKKNKPCPRWVRSAIKVLFGGFTYFVSVALPFLPSLGLFIGSLVMPLTLVYPCMMWLAVKKPVRYSKMWCINLGLGVLGVMFCGVCAGGALWSLIVDGLGANFFKPK